MKLSERTLAILKNYSTINNGILFKPGNEIRTITPQSQLMSAAKISEEIPIEAGLHNLSAFLTTLSLFDDPDVEFLDSHVEIKGRNSSAKIDYSSPETFVSAPYDKEPPMNDELAEFQLEAETLKSVLKACGILSKDSISFDADGTSIYVSTHDENGVNRNRYRTELGNTDKEFSVVLSVENMKLLPSIYKITLTQKILRFDANGLRYWIRTQTG